MYRLRRDIGFPPPELAREDGLLALGGDLTQDRLLLAYEMGIFPWYSDGQPILWWSPDPRMVLLPSEFHVARRLQRVINQGVFRTTFDQAFEDVIRECANISRPGQQGTWITDDMREAYEGLHQTGYAHSVEAWQGDRLVGGVYGVSLGRCFFGESMFSRVTDASKVALAALMDRLRKWDFVLLDCQVYTAHLASLGAREMPRKEFLTLLGAGLEGETRLGPWK